MPTIERRFDRDFYDPACTLSVIGDGELGGKAEGLRSIRETIDHQLDRRSFEGITVAIPRLTVLSTTVFDAFMERNGLYEVVGSGLSDDRLAHRFQQAELPAELVGDLRAIVSQVRLPLAVRSSSLLEDALEHPFAGVYATKMTPNNQLDIDTRFRRLAEAIRFVYASTFFAEAVSYRKSVRRGAEEKMAVILQEVVGRRYGDRFYPNLSGVARSYNYYPSGRARPEDGVAELALGLGKTIVDDGVAWSYSPAHPKAPPPYNTLGDLLKMTQTEFWSVNMGTAPHDPVQESEHLVKAGLSEAEADDTLRYVGSTYDPSTNRVVPGAAGRGPRVVNFAPVLLYNQLPVNPLVRALLQACGNAVGAPVEIEFALTIDPTGEAPASCGFLQVRPMVVSHESVDIEGAEAAGDRVLVSCDRALGNGVLDVVSDVVYVRPDRFDPRVTETIARELAAINESMVRAGRPYLLIGFGRWGTSDPTGGIPLPWGHISGARAIVEAQLANMRADLSQGSHFFHNLTSFRVLYFSVPFGQEPGVNWRFLDGQPPESESELIRHVRLGSPLLIKVDGRSGKGIILHD